MKTMIKYSVPLAAALLVMTGCASRKPNNEHKSRTCGGSCSGRPPQGRAEARVRQPVIARCPFTPTQSSKRWKWRHTLRKTETWFFQARCWSSAPPATGIWTPPRRTTSYFVPADNMPPQLAPPSKSYYDYIQSKKNGAIPAKQLDVSAVRVTGFTQKEDEAQAKAALSRARPWRSTRSSAGSPSITHRCRAPAPAATPR